MEKKVLRYFFDIFGAQEKWLNSMATRGFRLIKCGKMTYIFAKCEPAEYAYAVEFVSDRPYTEAKDYRGFLEGMGFRVLTKNINLNFSYGKVRWRPYARGKGQIATSPGGFNKELLIVEKKRDGKPFELHTNVSDKLSAFKSVRRAYAWATLLFLVGIAATFIPGISAAPATVIWAVRIGVACLSLLFLVPLIKYSALIGKLKQENKTFE